VLARDDEVIEQSGDFRSWQILLQKSKIDRCQKSRESRFLDTSTVARLCSADVQVRGQFCAKQ
jgi:hypothetical protein